MSEYEGKVPYRKPTSADLIDILYYEATGRVMTKEEKENLIKGSQTKKDKSLTIE